jgi:hypothetical protein
MVATEAPTGRYLYGIIPCAEARTFAARGIHEQGARVYSIPYRDLAVVVSDSPPEPYDSTRRNMMAHTRVLEALMQQYSVLPICFGIVAPDEVTICEQLLARRYDDLRAQLEAMHNRIELGLKAFWVDEDVFRRIADESPAIRALRDTIAGRTAESTYYERIRLGELVEEAIAQRREHDTERILGELRPLAAATILHPPLTERMVFNAAFLLGREHEARFDQAVREIDARMDGRLMFKYVGPVPPYNFVTINVSWS